MAEFKTQRTRTLANGSAIAEETIVVLARDSQGRQMTATTVYPTLVAEKAITHFQVFDPVAHVTLNWSFPGREATVMAIPLSGTKLQGCGFASGRIFSEREKTTVDHLGTKTILGVEAQGRRTTTRIPLQPVGKHKKQKPQASMDELVSTFELWRAIDPGLNGLVVRELSVDTQSVKLSRELVKFSQNEPDAAIFRVPVGYEIVNREVNLDPCVGYGEMEAPFFPNPALPAAPAK
jgi:hypothetical protein